MKMNQISRFTWYGKGSYTATLEIQFHFGALKVKKTDFQHCQIATRCNFDKSRDNVSQMCGNLCLSVSHLKPNLT